MRIALRLTLVAGTLALALSARPVVSAQDRGVARAECFPSETLPPDLRAKSEELLLTQLDREGLYTFVGGLKPITSPEIFNNAAQNTVPKDPARRPAVLAAAEERRRLLSAWRCGDGISAGVLALTNERSGDRFFETFIMHRPAVRRAVAAHREYFGALGITPTSDPIEAVLAVGAGGVASGAARGLGYLFGYPDYAVDWYTDMTTAAVEAQRAREKSGAAPPPRPSQPTTLIREVPTFAQLPRAGGTGSYFAYAVQPGLAENDADRALLSRAAVILEEYRKRRAQYIGTGKPGAFALLRDWYAGPDGTFSVENAVPPSR
jgi:hypothetical protein